MMRFEELHPIVSTKPEYFQVSRWTGHIPFSMLLVDLMRPRCFVELGTHYGVSYMAICQAVKMLNAGTQCYAVDTWTGDLQAGAYSDDVLSTLRARHDPAYGSFSTLMQMSFDEAAEHFDPGSIDLLHIDGCHQYEAVRHDFETWRPRLSDQAVVLFHDTVERNEELRFGVWRLWEDLSAEYPAFNFTHEHGLGVLAVGKNYASSLDAFFGRSPEEQALIRGQFCELGFQLKDEELLLREAGLTHHVKLLQQQVADLEQFGAGMQQLNAQIQGRIDELAVREAGLMQQVDLLQRRVVDLEQFGAGMQYQKNQLQEVASGANDKLAQLIGERNLLHSHLAVVERQKAKLDAELKAIYSDRLWRFLARFRGHKSA
jgi:O-antigen biosynthesis protein